MNTSGRNFPHQKNGTEPSTVHPRERNGYVIVRRPGVRSEYFSKRGFQLVEGPIRHENSMPTRRRPPRGCPLTIVLERSNAGGAKPASSARPIAQNSCSKPAVIETSDGRSPEWLGVTWFTHCSLCPSAEGQGVTHLAARVAVPCKSLPGKRRRAPPTRLAYGSPLYRLREDACV